MGRVFGVDFDGVVIFAFATGFALCLAAATTGFVSFAALLDVFGGWADAVGFDEVANADFLAISGFDGFETSFTTGGLLGFRLGGNFTGIQND